VPTPQLDHVVSVADASSGAGDGLDATAARLGAELGVEPVEGGVHTMFGTRNAILPWLGWAVRVDDPEPVAHRLARPIIAGGRAVPTGSSSPGDRWAPTS
jgi:hypothetical protein